MMLNNLNCFKNKNVLITGASGNLGRESARKFAELNADLILVDLKQKDLDQIKDELAISYGCIGIQTICCDFEIESERNKLIDEVIKTGDGLNVLVNNAAFVGTTGLDGWAVEPESQNLDAWRRAVEVNITSVFHFSQKLLPEIRKKANGCIVNIASIYGFLGPDWSIYEGTSMANPAGYAATKGGVIQLTRWMATTYGPGVRVNCVSPGGLFRNQPQSFVENYCKKTPLKRMGTEIDVANAVIFLASEMAAYITGQNLIVDGGFSAW
jgi:NAD(P)-dependent dehydrogenase (short-subunit alcohol dehydrogenase family)